MRKILHLLTRPADSLASDVIVLQRDQPQVEVTVVDLTAPQPDYAQVLEEIFKADSVEVW